MKIPNRFCFALWLALIALVSVLHAQRTQTALDGEWRLALDPVDVGVAQAWFKPGMPMEKWDKVTVPHSFTVDARYHEFTGSVWYRRSFTASRSEGVRVFLRFEAVFYRAQVWLNGKLLGEHEGGYTPFEFDVTDLLAGENQLAVCANNAWSTTTIPGAKTSIDYQSANYGQLYPWMNYGGLTREVYLITRPAACLDKIKVEAQPDLAANTARVRVSATVKNRSTEPWNPARLAFVVSLEGREVPARFTVTGREVAPNSEGEVQAEAELTGVRLWGFDHPVLYRLVLTADRDAVATTFGIRKIEVRGTKFLLNGEEVSLGGCNRPTDAPGHGSLDPASVVERDLQLIKAGGMILSRIAHYPVSPRLLDWADAHGLLLIAEAGNWQMTPAQMADPAMQAKFRSQMREMVERDWNHPSLIAWSVGNEYQSQTPEGLAWTKEMRDFVRSIDASRLITFASHTVGRTHLSRPEEEASQYVDFISANIYENHLERLRRIHAIYPDKPVYVSEFGIRTDTVASEQDRVRHLRQAVADFRACGDFVMGASVWTFNDYQSMFPGSNANGDRPWGLVSPEREIRDMYRAWQDELAPATAALETLPSGQLRVTLKARADFPRRTLRDCRLVVGDHAYPLPTLAPGASTEIAVDLRAGSGRPSIHLENAAGDRLAVALAEAPVPGSTNK